MEIMLIFGVLKAFHGFTHFSPFGWHIFITQLFFNEFFCNLLDNVAVIYVIVYVYVVYNQ